jgi:hypothetical protein
LSGPIQDLPARCLPLGLDATARAVWRTFVELWEGIMSDASRRKSKDSTSSGHGALGMGGQPSDDPRDLNSGGGDRADDDRAGRTGPVGGASGKKRGDLSGGSVTGVVGDKAANEGLGAKPSSRDAKR